MLKKEVIQKEIKRLRWLASQCDLPAERAFYLGAAIALEESVGYSTRDATRIEISYEHDFVRYEPDEQIEWNMAIHGDPFPISEEDWREKHPDLPIERLVDQPDGINEFSAPKRHDRIR